MKSEDCLESVLLSLRPTLPERPQTSLPLPAAQTLGPVGWGSKNDGSRAEAAEGR